MIRALALSLLLAGAAGCTPDRRDMSLQADDVQVSPPAVADVRAAVDDLGADIRRLYAGRWPKQYPMSQDFPEQPIAALLKIEDRGNTGANTAQLDRALEEAVRFQGQLRLYVDEVAVPPSLREDYPPHPIAPRQDGHEVEVGLHLVGWIDRVGRFRLELHDAQKGEVLLRTSSD